MSVRDQLWYTPLLVFCLVSIALLAALAGRRSEVQVLFAIVAVYFGAATILRSDFGPWFSGGHTRSARGIASMVTGCGVLVIGVGAAFLIT